MHFFAVFHFRKIVIVFLGVTRFHGIEFHLQRTVEQAMHLKIKELEFDIERFYIAVCLAAGFILTYENGNV